METKTVKISLLQMGSELGDVEQNCDKVKVLCEHLTEPTDVLVLPEVWTVGWACRYFRKTAQKISNSSVIDFLSSIARKYNTNIIGGSFIVKDGEDFYNTCPVLNREGNLVATYSKNHLYSYYGCDEDKYVTAGKDPVMVELDGVKFGLTICYDIRFPEIYRAYAKEGADILVNCAAWGAKKAVAWEMMTKSRAIENQCYMLALTQSGYIEDEQYNLGESRIIDYKGDEVNSLMKGEGIITSNLNLQEMYDFRAKSPILGDIKSSYEVKTLCVK
ncbi:hypothetical protein IJ579_07240 [bacterium]|nr:hypothetical protein [bacterium]